MSIVKNNQEVRSALIEKFSELRLTKVKVVADAKAKGVRINEGNLSRYLRYGNVPNTLSEQKVIWLCNRWGVKLKLTVSL